MKTKKRLLSVLLSLALMLGLMPGMSLTAYAAEASVTLQNGTLSSGVISSTLLDWDTTDIYYTKSGATITAGSGKIITKIEMNKGSIFPNSFNSSGVGVSPGDATYDSNKITVTNINSSTVRLSRLGTLNVACSSIVVYYDDPIAVTGVTLDPSTTKTIDVGDSVAFTATIAPDNAADKKVKWSVGGDNASAVKLYSDADCTAGNEVTLDTATETLTVYAKGMSAGSATVTVTATNGTDVTTDDKSASCVVTVNAIHVHSFTYSAEGETITATCREEDCDLANNTATLTITAPTTVGGAAGVTGDTVLTDGATIKYATKNGSEWGAPTTNVPSTAGTYQASVTLGENEGAATASVEYGIYSISVADGITNGAITGNPALALGGSTIQKPTITPEAGYEVETYTVTDSNGQNVTVAAADGSFTMPNADVTLNATFAARSVPVKLVVTGAVDGTATPLTASILKDGGTYQTVDTTDAEHPFTKKVGETFLLRVTCDEDYTYSISSKAGGAKTNMSVKTFTKEEYGDYVEHMEGSNEPTYTRTSLLHITMPVVASGDLEITVKFSKIQLNTVLYQAPSSMEKVWCKYQYGTGVQAVTITSEMSKEAKLGGQDVWSLKLRSGGASTDQVAFAETKEGLDSAGMASVTLYTSADSNWMNYGNNNGSYLVIGGQAKILTAAFITDKDKLVIFDSDNAEYTQTKKGEGTGAIYQLAVCPTDAQGNVTEAGTITAPAAPDAPEGYKFVTWKGFVRNANGNTEEKTYGAGTSNIEIREDTVFYSEWQLQQPEITWDGNGGTGTVGAASVNYNETVSEPTAPTKNGYAFDGWAVGEEVVEDGTLFSKGTIFDFTKKITADLTLVAQWKHVHSYKYYKLDDKALNGMFNGYDKYIKHLHLRYCGCGDYKLEAHCFDSSGKCVSCGYAKTQIQTTVTIKYSYGIYENSTYQELFTENPEQKKKGSEISIYAPTELSEDLEFDKWEYRMDNNQSGQIDDEDEWKDLSASPMGFFVVPADMELRASYKSTSVQPQMELYSKRYNNTLVFRMNYRLPDGYTYVDSGVRAGDNAQISYYRRVEKTKASQSVSAGEKMAEFGATAAIEFLTGGDDIFDVASDYFLSPLLDSAFDSLFGIEEKPQYTWEKREDCVLNIMSKQTLGEYMYQKKPINIPGDMLLWSSNPLSKGQAGSCYTLIPEKWGGPGNNGGNHWNYGYAFLKYKTPDGQIKTFHTDAIAATYNQIGDSTTATAN